MTERGGTSRASHAGRPGRPGRWSRGALAGAGVVAVLVLGGCGGSEPTLADLPAGVAEARPSISAEEADFVLAAQELGATVTGATVDDDIETGTTTCWALQNGGVDLAQIAVDDETGKPLANTGEALRTKQLMAAGVQTFCPDHDDQIGQLRLP
ncbi:hypothetical protein [Terrabacter aeriphilus]|uniref:hypothetical protein n=1 Tax=Terrabacter aeriphilus TaxID=515662 RepID=UPI0031EAA09A